MITERRSAPTPAPAPPRARVAILVHRDEEFEPRYVLHQVAALWREDGCEVTVQRGPGPVPAADLAILHVDATRVPGDHLRWIRRFPRSINGGAFDISKRRVSANLVRPGDGWSGPVIVKTNGNAAGHPDACLAVKRSLLERLRRARRDRLPWWLRREMGATEYPIYDSPRRVPAGVWWNRHLVVERFLPEVREGFYCLRTWLFLGDRETHSLSYSRQPVVKGASIERRELLGEVPAELRAARRRLGFDFGKFDYTLVDGRPVLLDANRTPTLPNTSHLGAYMQSVRLLADGLRSML